MKYVYMLGIDNDDWTVQDTKECKKYDVKVKGYYEIGGIEGMVLVGELENLEDLMEMYFGLEIAEDYLCLEDEFDYEDGKWISGSWKETKSTMKESKEFFVGDKTAKGFEVCMIEDGKKYYLSKLAKNIEDSSWSSDHLYAKHWKDESRAEEIGDMLNSELKESKKSMKESKEYNFDYFYQLLKDDKHFSVNYAHDDLPDDDTVYANGTVDVKWFIDGKRLNHSAILSIPCFSMVFTSYEGLLFNCENGSRYNSVIGYADISDVRFTSDVLSLLLVNGLRVTFNLY